MKAAEKASLKEHVESLLHADIDAINTRNWDALHNDKSPDFLIHRFHDLHLAPDGSRVAPDGHLAMTLGAWIAWIKGIVEAKPGYQVQVYDVVTHISEKTKTAEVFMNTAVSGIFEGAVTRNVTTMTYRCVEGAWVATHSETLRGIDVEAAP